MDLHYSVSFHNRTTVDWRRKEHWEPVTHFHTTVLLVGLKSEFWNALDLGGGLGWG